MGAAIQLCDFFSHAHLKKEFLAAAAASQVHLIQRISTAKFRISTANLMDKHRVILDKLQHPQYLVYDYLSISTKSISSRKICICRKLAKVAKFKPIAAVSYILKSGIKSPKIFDCLTAAIKFPNSK